MTDAPALQRVLYDVLRATYVRLIARGEGRDPDRIHPTEQESMVDANRAEFAHDLGLLMEVMGAARRAGAEGLREKLHAMPKTDSEMLEEALEFVREREGDDAA
jgi:hypothetical protein